MNTEPITIEQYKIIKLLYTGDYLAKGLLSDDILLVPVAKSQLSSHQIFSQLQQYKTQNQITQHGNINNDRLSNLKYLQEYKQIIFPQKLINSHQGNNKQNAYLCYSIPKRSVWICNLSTIRLKSELYCVSLMYNAYQKVLKPLVNALQQKCLQYIEINNAWVRESHLYLFLKPKNQENKHKIQSLQEQYKAKRTLKKATYNRDDLEKIALKKLANILFKTLYNDHQEHGSKMTPYMFLSHLLIMMFNQSINFSGFETLMNDKTQRKKFMHDKRKTISIMPRNASPQSTQKRNHKFYLFTKQKQRPFIQNPPLSSKRNESLLNQTENILPPSFTSNKKHNNIFKNRAKTIKQRYTQSLQGNQFNGLQNIYKKQQSFITPNKHRNYQLKQIFPAHLKNRHNSLTLSQQYCKIKEESQKKVFLRYRKTIEASKSKEVTIEKSPSEQRKAMEQLKNRIKKSLHLDKAYKNYAKQKSQKANIKRYKTRTLNEPQLQKKIKKSLQIQKQDRQKTDNQQQNTQKFQEDKERHKSTMKNSQQDIRIDNSFIHMKLQELQEKKHKIYFNANNDKKTNEEDSKYTNEIQINNQKSNIVKFTEGSWVDTEQKLPLNKQQQTQLRNPSRKNTPKVQKDKNDTKETKNEEKIKEISNKTIKQSKQQKLKIQQNEKSSTKKQQQKEKNYYEQLINITKEKNKSTILKASSKPELTNAEHAVSGNLFNNEESVDYVDIPSINILDRSTKPSNQQINIQTDNKNQQQKKKSTKNLKPVIEAHVTDELQEIHLVDNSKSKKQTHNNQLQLVKVPIENVNKNEEKDHPDKTNNQKATNKKQAKKQMKLPPTPQKKNTSNTQTEYVEKKQRKYSTGNPTNRLKSNQSEIASSYGPKKSVQKQVQQYIHMVNKIGEAVAKTSKISKKLQGIEWYIGLYFVYKRFYFERKKIYEYLQNGIPKLSRYENSINQQQWDSWLKTDFRQNLVKKIAEDNVSIGASIQKMSKNLSKRSNIAEVEQFINLKKCYKQESSIGVEYVVDQFDQLWNKKFSKKQEDEQICIHMTQMLNSLQIIAQLDGKIKQKKPLNKFSKRMKVTEMKEFADNIYKLYGLDED